MAQGTVTLQYIDGREAGASKMGSQDLTNVSSLALSVESAALDTLLQNRGHNVSLAASQQCMVLAVYGAGRG